MDLDIPSLGSVPLEAFYRSLEVAAKRFHDVMVHFLFDLFARHIEPLVCGNWSFRWDSNDFVDLDTKFRWEFEETECLGLNRRHVEDEEWAGFLELK
jgi:hypothetical protein